MRGDAIGEGGVIPVGCAAAAADWHAATAAVGFASQALKALQRVQLLDEAPLAAPRAPAHGLEAAT